MQVDLEVIEDMIYVIRGQRVMLDSDLANLYGVKTKALNQAIKRNLNRFPIDFMFKMTTEEYDSLRSQFVTSKKGRGGRRHQPLVFTENGVAMLSSVLNSDIAIDVNIAIMRIFTKLRSFLMLKDSDSKRIDTLEKGSNHLFKVVFERLDSLEETVPSHSTKRKRIGLKDEN